MKKNLYIFWDRKSTPKLDEFKVGRNFAYSDSRVVDSMDVVPLAKSASMPMLPIEENIIAERRKKFAYFLFAGRIQYAECVDSEGLVFDNLEELKVEDGNALKVDNFFVLKGKAWFATRFELKTGDLDLDGKIVRNVSIVQGIPKYTEMYGDPEAEYYHILRCCIGKVNDNYRMFTEEALMYSKKVGSSGMNNHSRICEYRSSDMKAWWFQAVLYEDYEKNPYKQGWRVNSEGKDMYRGKFTKLQEMKMFRRNSAETEVADLSKPLQENVEFYGTDFVLVDKKFRAYIWKDETASVYQSDDGAVWKLVGPMLFLNKPWQSVRFLSWGNE